MFLSDYDSSADGRRQNSEALSPLYQRGVGRADIILSY